MNSETLAHLTTILEFKIMYGENCLSEHYRDPEIFDHQDINYYNRKLFKAHQALNNLPKQYWSLLGRDFFNCLELLEKDRNIALSHWQDLRTLAKVPLNSYRFFDEHTQILIYDEDLIRAFKDPKAFMNIFLTTDINDAYLIWKLQQ